MLPLFDHKTPVSGESLGGEFFLITLKWGEFSLLHGLGIQIAFCSLNFGAVVYTTCHKKVCKVMLG